MFNQGIDIGFDQASGKYLVVVHNEDRSQWMTFDVTSTIKQVVDYELSLLAEEGKITKLPEGGKGGVVADRTIGFRADDVT